MIETKYSQVLNLLDQGRAQADEKISAVTLNNTESSAEIKQDLEKRSTELKARLEGFDRETADKMTSLAKTLDVFTGSLDQQVKQRERKEDCLSHTSSAIMEVLERGVGEIRSKKH